MGERHLRAVMSQESLAQHRERLSLLELALETQRVAQELNRLQGLAAYPDVPVELSNEIYVLGEVIGKLHKLSTVVGGADRVIREDLPLARGAANGRGNALKPIEIVRACGAAAQDQRLRTTTYRKLMEGVEVTSWQSRGERARMQHDQDLREAREAFDGFPCEYCKAEPGEDCMTKGGYVAIPAHAARLKLLRASKETQEA